MMISRLLLFFTLVLSLHADLSLANKAMSNYTEKYMRWERSFLAAEDIELKRKILEDKPDARRVSETVMLEINAVLSEPAAMQGISWIYKNDPGFLTPGKESNPGTVIRAALKRYHYRHAGAGDLCISISQSFSPADMSFMEKVVTQSPYKEDQGLAALATSIALSSMGDEAELLGKRLTYLKKAITLLPSGTMVEGESASKVIEDQIYVITNLTKGRVAPVFSGSDFGGRPVARTGETGMVSALVFWSDKDLRLGGLLPILEDTHKLLQEVGGKMIGIYSGDPDELRTLIAERKVPWENIYDAESAVTKQYRINKTPTVFVLDKSGKIQSIGQPNALVNLSIRALANTTE